MAKVVLWRHPAHLKETAVNLLLVLAVDLRANCLHHSGDWCDFVQLEFSVYQVDFYFSFIYKLMNK